MQFLIVSDMHGNWDAFGAVLEAVRDREFDTVLVLGDLVGYGASPNEIIAAVHELPGTVHVIRGNHDKVVAEIEDGSNFNQAALSAARWTTDALSPEHLAFIRELPEGPLRVMEGLQICHGSPLDEDIYVFSDYDAYEIFAHDQAELTFFGHTHIPSLFALHERGIDVALLKGETGTIEIEEGRRYLINPGSVGQPRDRDPRAAFMTYDSEARTVTWHRLPYPVESAQRKIEAAGLPKVLADRLAVGI